MDVEPEEGQRALEQHCREAGSDTPGINLSGANWPGFTGTVSPHGAVFSKE